MCIRDRIYGEVTDLLIENNKIKGVSYQPSIHDEVKTEQEVVAEANSVVLTNGTILGSLIHLGHKTSPAGWVGENPSIKLANTLRATGLNVSSLKTGTPPQFWANSIDWRVLE